MSDFLSRLVERTYGLVPRVQPVARSIFAPKPLVKSDYIHDLAYNSESVSNQDEIHIDSFRKPRIIPQSNDQPALNRENPFNKDDMRPHYQIEDRDNQRNLTSMSRPEDNIEQLMQYESVFPKRIEVPLNQMGGQDNRYLHLPPAELAQDNESLSRIDSDTLESVVSEPVYLRNLNNQSHMRLITKSVFEEQSHLSEGSQRYSGPFIRGGDNSGKTLFDHILDSDHTQGSSLISESSIKNNESALQSREPASRADFYPLSHLHPDAKLPSVIPRRQKLKQTSTPKVDAALEQMGNMLIGQNAVSSGFSSTTPTVKVTIGRIEVRAVKTPLETQSQTPPPRQRQTLSLDDYLKQHNGR